MIRCVLTQYVRLDRLDEHEMRCGAGLAHDVIRTSDRARSIGILITVTQIPDQIVDNKERQRKNTEPDAAPTMNWICLLQV